MPPSFPYVALEGCDGAGKSTIRRRISAYLRKRHIPVLEIGQHSWLNISAARMILDARENRRAFPPSDISAAYRVDKTLHAQHNILRNTQRALVLADRSIISDAVYQEALYGIPADRTIDAYLHSGQMFPSVVILVTVPVEIAVQRIAMRGRHRRHYEQETDLRTISAIYERVLRQRGGQIAATVVFFSNEHPDLDHAVSHNLLPVIHAACAGTVFDHGGG